MKTEIKPTCEFYIEKHKTFTVSVKAWWYKPSKGEEYKTGWNWNVYAYVFDNHPKFGDNEWLRGLPLHWGCSFDKLVTEQPFEIKYDFQSVVNSKVVGSDYNHLYDDCGNHESPFDGIPSYVLRDAEELVKALLIGAIK